MKLSEIQITHCRNIVSLKLPLHPLFNIISGPNGSGKTAFLEALYILARGQSFRVREISPLITQHEDVFTVYAQTIDDQSVSIQKTKQGLTKAKINTKPCHSASELASFLPLQWFDADLFDVIQGGPSRRRAVLDWGLFHVEHEYHALWKSYQKILQHRQVLLKKKADPSTLLPWNTAMVPLAEQIDGYRKKYIEQLNIIFQALMTEWQEKNCYLQYEKGWHTADNGLLERLTANYERDIKRQLTHEGPHQADMFIKPVDGTAKQWLSRGEQKMAILALKLAQSCLLSNDCLLLIDDVAAELDEGRVEKLITYLKNTTSQVFLTARPHDASLLVNHLPAYQHYKISQGQFTPV